ncbi:MAG: 30S ribosomal protein S17 [Patescibacteria group bacterium]
MSENNSQVKQKIAKPRKLFGVVVSDKMDKTVVVEVTKRIKHVRYGKFINKNKRYKAHLENRACQLGDKVTIMETKPFSKDKSFKVIAVNGQII